MSTSSSESETRLQELLRGFPEATIRAVSEFRRTASQTAFDEAFAGVIEHHLQQPAPMPVSQLPGTTSLSDDLGLDSLTMVEMAFLFEDLFSTKLPHEDYVKVNTLDDLRRLLLDRLQSPPTA